MTSMRTMASRSPSGHCEPVVTDHDRPVRGVLFDEQTLRADIVSVWGEHGAHVDVFDHILAALRDRDTQLAELRSAAWPKFCPICLAEFHADGTVTPSEGSGRD
jgi:hypothetical protein